jgi:PAS domain S-box-containing protein
MGITYEKQTESQLRPSEEHYRLLYEESPTVNTLITLDGIILDLNKQGLKSLGYKKEEVIGQPFSNFLIPEQREFLHEQLHIGAQGLALPELELSIYAKDGSVHRFLTIPGKVILNHNTLLDGYICSAIEITERKRMADELTLANSELEAFSYSVAHDLRNPLYSMTSLLNMFSDEFKAGLQEPERQALRWIDRDAHRMADIISDLLSLSQISRHQMQKKTVDLSAIVRMIFNELKTAEPSREVMLEIKSECKAEADPGLTTILLENIIRNAWKFTSKRADAHIEFGVVEGAGSPVCYLRDNGMGFDMAKAERLFKPFERLHSDKEISGTGIGLAIVDRIVKKTRWENMGGR